MLTIQLLEKHHQQHMILHVHHIQIIIPQEHFPQATVLGSAVEIRESMYIMSSCALSVVREKYVRKRADRAFCERSNKFCMVNIYTLKSKFFPWGHFLKALFGL